MGLLTVLPLYAVPPLSQLPGTAGCVSDLGGEGACALGRELPYASAVAVSPDGRNVYVGSFTGLAIFDRDPSTGELEQKEGQDGCIHGISPDCGDGRGLFFVASLAVSPDGSSLYAASLAGLAVFDRDPVTGTVEQKAGTEGCFIEEVNNEEGECESAVGVFSAASVAVSADGRNVYVASFLVHALAVFDRDVSTGQLDWVACTSEDGERGCTDGRALGQASSVAVSPDGRSVYVASGFSGAVAVFDRDPATGQVTQPADATGCISDDGTGGECLDGRALGFAVSVAVSEDGIHVYVASAGSDAVAIFDRNPATGRLTQKSGAAGCIDITGVDCVQGAALAGASRVTVSPDGGSVYVASSSGNAVAVLDRNLTNGELAQKAGPAGCVSETGGACTSGTAFYSVRDVAASPDSRTVYVVSSTDPETGDADTGAVAIFDRDVPPYDIDGDGEISALSDGLLLMRYMFGFGGALLISGAVDLANCTRCSAAAIEAYLRSLSTL